MKNYAGEIIFEISLLTILPGSYELSTISLPTTQDCWTHERPVVAVEAITTALQDVDEDGVAQAQALGPRLAARDRRLAAGHVHLTAEIAHLALVRDVLRAQLRRPLRDDGIPRRDRALRLVQAVLELLLLVAQRSLERGHLAAHRLDLVGIAPQRFLHRPPDAQALPDRAHRLLLVRPEGEHEVPPATAQLQ